MIPPVICVSGIDTDIGKSVATGLLARFLARRGSRVTTMKLVQTGCVGLAEDLLVHRSLMGVEPNPEDLDGRTCPYVFPVPCSPHLAAELAGVTIDPARLDRAVAGVAKGWDTVLLEGAGGLMVPLTRSLTLLDYLAGHNWPLLLVSSPRLGSINHTLSALELAHGRGLPVLGIIYNRFQEADERIVEDSRQVFAQALAQRGFNNCVLDLLGLDVYLEGEQEPDFSRLFPGGSERV